MVIWDGMKAPESTDLLQVLCQVYTPRLEKWLLLSLLLLLLYIFFKIETQALVTKLIDIQLYTDRLTYVHHFTGACVQHARECGDW